MHKHNLFGLGAPSSDLAFIRNERAIHETSFLYLYTFDFVTHRRFILTMHIMHNITFKNWFLRMHVLADKETTPDQQQVTRLADNISVVGDTINWWFTTFNFILPWRERTRRGNRWLPSQWVSYLPTWVKCADMDLVGHLLHSRATNVTQMWAWSASPASAVACIIF